MNIVPVLGEVPFDGRTLDVATAESTMLDCISRLKRGAWDGVAAWLLFVLMYKGWGFTPNVQLAIDSVTTRIDHIFLRGCQFYWGYGVDKDNDEAFRLWSEGVKIGDPSGRCHGRLGVCSYGFGTEKATAKAIELLSEGAQLGDAFSQYWLDDCYLLGAGVPEDEEKAQQLVLMAHQQGYVDATYSLAQFNEFTPLEILLLREAAARGHVDAKNKLEGMREYDPSSVIPFGCWAPHVHRWVSDSMHQSMMSILMINRRRPADPSVDPLPNGVMMIICFYTCCKPEAYVQPSAEVMLIAQQQRQNWKLSRDVAQMKHQLDTLEQSTKILPGIQEQLGSLLKMVSTLVTDRKSPDLPQKRTKK